MALPALPVQGQNPWYIPRTNWDTAVEDELEGRLSEASLTAFRGPFITDQQYPSLTSAISALPSGGTLEIRGSHSSVVPYVINKPCTIRFNGGSITNSTATANVFSVTSNGVTFVNPKLIGAGVNVTGTARGIQASGAVGTPISNFTVLNPDITQFNYIAIEARNVNDASVTGGKIYQCGYAGVMFLSVSRGRVLDARIQDITMPAGYVNSYGIAFTNFSDTEPPSVDCVAEGNYISGVPWEALDTHGAINAVFRGNTVRSCGVGVAVVGGPGGVSARNAQVLFNDIADCNYSGGIVFAGSGTNVAGTPGPLMATGIIMGNTLVRCGQDATNMGGIVVYNTQSLAIVNNVIEEPSVSGIIMNYNNVNAVVSGNVVTDPWSATILTQAIYSGQLANTSLIHGNSLRRGTKAAARVNEHGIRVSGSAPAGSLILGINDMAAATAPLTDSPGATQSSPLARAQRLGVTGGTVGFYGTTPVTKPTGVPVTAAGVHAALVTLGLISA